MPSIFFVVAIAVTFPAAGHRQGTSTELSVLWIICAISIAMMWHFTRSPAPHGTAMPSPADLPSSARPLKAILARLKQSLVDVTGDVRKQGAAKLSPVEAERRTFEKWGKAAQAGSVSASVHVTTTWSREHRTEIRDEIEFEYRDFEGAPSKRRVIVTEMAQEHFEGYCLLRKATRTFRYDRVDGLITRMDTGELLSCNEWRDQAEELAR
ncbi:hypothetical protein [Cupriavidus oxalaticus]|uniref:hypothetical protein n=1 Tax=Cupriavidus oxalaticus TaxID=96344 RepID=UPI0011C1A4DD|nr:hypothetical protein [Cupriavidus oxalaticus]